MLAVCQRFGETCWSHRQGFIPSALTMDAICSSETLAYSQKNVIPCNNPELKLKTVCNKLN
jgi:hypothetical protein